MIPSPGQVIIRPHPHNTSTKTVVVDDEFSPEHNFSVTGEVVAVSGPADFFVYDGNYQDYDAHEARENRLRAGASREFDVPVEIKAGDIVVFPYFYHLKDDLAQEEQIGDGNLLIPYESLMARIDGSRIYPLNGMVAGTEVPKDVGMAKLRKAPVSNIYRIVAEGCRVKRYSGYGYPDRKEKMTGKVVSVFPNSAVAPEVDMHKILNDNKLYFFHRRNILGYVQ